MNDLVHYPAATHGWGTPQNPSTAIPGGAFGGTMSNPSAAVPGGFAPSPAPASNPTGGSWSFDVNYPAAPPPRQMPAFDYRQAILNDPSYQQATADLAAGRVSDLASLRSARQRAVAGFGQVPDFNSLDQGVIGQGFQQDITPEIQQLAQKNTAAGLSTSARLNQTHEDQVRAITNALAASGALHSGEYGFQLNREQQGYTQAQFDARSNLLNALGGYNQGYAEGERQRQAQAQQAAQAAAQAQLQQQQLMAQAYQYPAAPPPTITYNWNPGDAGPAPPPPPEPPAPPAPLPPPPPPPPAARPAPAPIPSWGAPPPRRVVAPAVGQRRGGI